MGVEHPAIAELDKRKFPPSCFLVEISEDARPGGLWTEGDVLVVDEARSFGHGDLVVAEVEGEFRLFKSHRVGSRCRLLPTAGGQGCLLPLSSIGGWWCKPGVGRCRLFLTNRWQNAYIIYSACLA
ncbi:S24 family peptidase [Halomonas sp. PA16-9]|uniref:S24 family peptidase n=1 Tax=Halomonas sp. PA16-9 TaxID=2576841 RepID=UPI003FA5D47E